MAINPLLYWYMGNRCSHCGLTIQEILDQFGKINRIFQFNHIDPSKKAPNYDNVIRRKLSAEQLNELDKCALLCDRCHNALHAQNINITSVFTVKAEGRVFTHELECQVLIDRKHQTVMLFTDQLDDVFLYWVKLGENEEELYSGRQLRESDTLMKLVHKTRDSGPLIIATFQGDWMLAARKIGDNKHELKIDPRFPGFSFDVHFRTADPTSRDMLSFFLRNGKLLTNLGHGADSDHSRILLTLKGPYDPKYSEG